jgi:hypothetical protein
VQPGGEQTVDGSRDRGSVAFLGGIAAALGLLVIMMLLLAAQESFSRDDFISLAHVRKPVWSWLDTYLPLEKRWGWAYRPLGTDTYFYVCSKLFGWNPLAFFSVSLGLHFLTSILVYRVAIQLGFERRVAVVTGLLAVSRHPTLWQICYASAFYPVATVFLALLATSLFLDYARKGAMRFQAGSCLALSLALLCSEFPIGLPVLYVFLSLWASSTNPAGRLDTKELIPSVATLLRAVRRALPQFAIVALYLVVRLGVIASARAPASYGVNFAPQHLVWRVLQQIFYLFSDWPTLFAAGLLILAITSLVMVSEERREILRWLLPVNAICVLWILGTVAPFLVLNFSHSRYSVVFEVPTALLVGSYLSALWYLYGRRHRKALEVALVVLAFAALPYRTVWERSHKLYGSHSTSLLTAVSESYPDIEPNTHVVLLYNAPGLASYAGGSLFRNNVYGGDAARQAYWPGKGLTMDFHNLWEQPVSGDCERCVYFQLLPELEVAAAEKRFLEFRSPYYEGP